MVSVRPISELTIDPNGCFAFVGPCTSLTIVYEHPNGRQEREDFEAFAHSTGTIIKLEKTFLSGNSTWGLTAVLDSGEEYRLHLPTYEDSYKYWENKELGPHDFLAFMDSVEIIDDPGRPFAVEDRCDKDYGYGPRIHNPTDGVKPTPIDFSLLKNFGAAAMVLSINGVSHISGQAVHGIGQSWKNWPCVTLAARTLSGMLRQLCEWKYLYEEGIATEYYAEKAHLFIEALGLTEEMIEELKLSEVPMPTERFMKGHGDPRHGVNETGNLPLSIKNHLKKQLFYDTLSSLEAQHPSHPEIEQTLKNEEKEFNERNVLMYAKLRLPEVPISEITVEEIYDSYYSLGKYKGVIQPVLTQHVEVSLNGIKAARFFDATS